MQRHAHWERVESKQAEGESARLDRLLWLTEPFLADLFT